MIGRPERCSTSVRTTIDDRTLPSRRATAISSSPRPRVQRTAIYTSRSPSKPRVSVAQSPRERGEYRAIRSNPSGCSRRAKRVQLARMTVVLVGAWVALALWCALVIAARRRRRRIGTPPADIGASGAAVLLVWVCVGVVASIELTWLWTGVFVVTVLSPVIPLVANVRHRRA